MQKKYLNILLLIFILQNTSFAQKINETRFDLIQGAGIHFSIDPRYPPLHNPVYFTEFDVAKTTFQNKYWHFVQHFPEIGLSIIANSNAEARIFGKSFAIIPSFGMRLNSSQKIRIFCRLGLGLGYVQHWYNRKENPLNLVVGTPINIAANAKFFVDFKLKSNHYITFGANAIHYSNAKIQLPNLGINIIGAYVGYRYILKQTKLDIEKTNAYISVHDSIKDKYFIQCRTGIGFTNTQMQGGGWFPINTYALALGKTYGKKRAKIYLGTEFHNNSATKTFDKLNEIDIEPDKFNRIAAFIGHEFLFSHIGFILQSGINIKREKLSRSIIYNKLGYNFYLKDNNKKQLWNAYLGVYVQAAAGEAEFPEITFGIQF